MFLNSLNRMVNGGALHYVIFVVFVITAITSLFIVHRGLRVREFREEIRYFEKLDDLNSGLMLFLNGDRQLQEGNRTEFFLFGDSSRRVTIVREAHGLLDLLTAQVDYRGKVFSKHVLTGMDPFRGDSLALYVPDKGQGLFASGNTQINGNARLPAKGIQGASIEGKPLHRSKPVSGKISQSRPSLPLFAERTTQKIKAALERDSLDCYSRDIGMLWEAELDASYADDPLWFCSEDDFQVSGISVSGRVGFYSDGTILLKKDASLDGVILSASKIIVEDGFQGKVQLFAQDSLVTGEFCQFKFPSVLCVYNEDVNPVHVEFGLGSQLQGTLICYQTNLSSEKPHLLIQQGATVQGQVYHQGKLELLGRIHGSLHVENFYLTTRRAFYENHLLDNEIDFLKLPPQSVFIDLFEGTSNQVIKDVGLEL